MTYTLISMGLLALGGVTLGLGCWMLYRNLSRRTEWSRRRYLGSLETILWSNFTGLIPTFLLGFGMERHINRIAATALVFLIVAPTALMSAWIGAKHYTLRHTWRPKTFRSSS